MIDEMKGRLVQSDAERVRRIESGEQKVVGVNSFTETEPSPLADIAQRGGIVTIDPAVERAQVEALEAWRAARDQGAVDEALAAPARGRRDRPRTSCPRRSRSPAPAAPSASGPARCATCSASTARPPASAAVVGAARRRACKQVRARVQAGPRPTGGPIRLLVGKPGLDGHSNGAEQIAVAARDAGMEVVYQGIRLTPAQIAAAARDEDVDVVGLSILSGSHLDLVPETLRELREAGVDAPVVVGGIIPDADRAQLERAGRRPGLHAQGLPTRGHHGRHRRPRTRAPQRSGGGSDPPMRTRMQDPRLVVAVSARRGRARRRCRRCRRRLRRARRRRGRGRCDGRDGRRRARRARPPERDRLADRRGRDPPRCKRELASINAVLAGRSEPARRRSRARPDRRTAHAREAASTRSTPRPVSTTRSTSPCSCSSRSPRRAVRCDPSRSSSSRSTAWATADRETRVQALGVVGDVVRRTLRESDAACRLGDLMVGAILEDTPEAGAVWAAERVRGTLLVEPGRRRAHVVGRRRVLPDARAGRGRARAPGDPRARRSARPRSRPRRARTRSLTLARPRGPDGSRQS